MNAIKETEQVDVVTERITSILARVLGIVFLFSGIGKMFALSSFAGTVADLAGFSSSYSFVIALTVIGIELVGGIGFVFGYRVPRLSLLFMLLVGMFTFVLVGALVQRKEFVCNCFGIFDLGLTSFQEIVFNVSLLNLLFVLAALSRKPWIAVTYRHALVLILVVVAEYTMIAPLEKFNQPKPAIDRGRINSFLETKVPEFLMSGAARKVVFLLRYTDFSCPPCLESFIAFADSLRTRKAVNRGYLVVGIMQEDETLFANAQSRLVHWKEANGLDFPLVLAPDSLFRQMNNGKSAIAIWEGSEVLFFHTFPLSVEQFRSVLAILE